MEATTRVPCAPPKTSAKASTTHGSASMDALAGSGTQRLRPFEDKPRGAHDNLLQAILGHLALREEALKGEAKQRNNGYMRSFHDKLLDQCLDRELLGSLLEAKVILKTWRIEYNESSPHSSRGYHTPGELSRRRNSGLRSPCAQS